MSFMDWFKWRPGRLLHAYYSKMLLFKIPLFMDCYLIRVNGSAAIGYHTDKVEGKRHFRLNIFLIKRNCEHWINYRPVEKRIVFFRPDIEPHSLACPEENSKALILSFGWAIK
jgi:hypothetical protein